MHNISWIVAISLALISGWWLYRFGLRYRGEYLPFLAIRTIEPHDKPQSNEANPSFQMLQQTIDLVNSNQLAAAQQRYQQAMNLSSNLNAQDKIAILALAHDYALELNRRRQWELVACMLPQIITEQQVLLGIEHEQTLNSMHTLAVAHMQQADYAQADALYQTLLQHYLKRLTQTANEDFSFVIANYTQLLLRQTRLADIANLHQQILALPGAFPDQYNDEAQKLEFLFRGLNLMQTNDLDLPQTIADYRQLQTYTETYLGETHKLTLETTYFLAAVLDDAGNIVESRQLLDQIHPIYQQKLPISDIFRHEFGFNYVDVLDRSGMHAQALALSENLINQIGQLQPPSPWLGKITEQHAKLVKHNPIKA